MPSPAHDARCGSSKRAGGARGKGLGRAGALVGSALLVGMPLLGLQCGSKVSYDDSIFPAPTRTTTATVAPPPLANDGGCDDDAGAKSDGGYCGCSEISLVTDIPNLYFVLDRSGSMESDGKWETMRSVVAEVIGKLGGRIRFATAVYPGTAEACAPGGEVLSLRRGDTPVQANGPAVRAFLAATQGDPEGGTPTAATLAKIVPKLQAMTGRTVVVLATDGAPNCNPKARCAIDRCILNIDGVSANCQPSTSPNCCSSADNGRLQCVDYDESVRVVSSLSAMSIPTYVLGAPGTERYASVLDALALAGGTAKPERPYFYAISRVERASFLEALTEVAAKIVATCTFTLGGEPVEGKTNVYLDGAVVPRDGADGWVLEGQTLRLVGSTCERVMNGQVFDVRVIAGCPTVVTR